MDNFTTTKRHTEFFLLTHAHADHLKGLESGGFSGHTIYCSKITKELIRQNAKYNRNITSIKSLKENYRHRIPTSKGYVSLTLIPARHCPGAVMFLIEDDTRAVLLTGDIRAEKDWVESLPRNRFLFPYTTSYKQLDNIYLDTTYGYRGEPFIEMNSNYYGLQSLMELIKMYPDDPSISFYFADSTIGYEEAWIQVLIMLDVKMHVPQELHKRLKMLSDHDEFEYSDIIYDICSLNPNSKFHCCGVRPQQCLGPLAKFPVRIKHCIDINIKDLMNLTLPLPFKDYENEATFVEELPQGHKIYMMDDIVYMLPKGETNLLRNELRFFFSRHSSYEECRHFVSMFNVKQVYPLTESAITWEQGFQMKRQFGDLCTADVFLYDTISSRIYGSPPTGLNPPFIVNKWNESLFLRSWNSDRKLLTASREFEFRGQQTVRNVAFRNDLDDEEEKIMKEKESLYHRNKVFSGINQYRVQGKIKTLGYGYLKKFKLDETSSQDHGWSQEDYDSMDRAMYQLNQSRREITVVLDDTNSPVNQLQSPFIPVPKSCDSQRLNTNSQSPQNSHLSILKGQLMSSPLSPRKKHTNVDLTKIEKIAKAVINDEDFGFFHYELKSCSKPPVEPPHIVLD